MKRIVRILLAILGLYLIACAVLGVVVAEVALHPPRHAITAPEEAGASAWAENDGARLSNVEIRATDGIALRAWEVEPEDANGSIVLLLHGRGGNRLEMVNYADILLTHGYSILMPDARAHGSSGGIDRLRAGTRRQQKDS